MKPVLNEPHGMIRNASTQPKKRDHRAQVANQSTPIGGTDNATTGGKPIVNSSKVQVGRKKK